MVHSHLKHSSFPRQKTDVKQIVSDLSKHLEHQENLEAELVLESFNQHVMLTTDVGSERIAPM